MRVLVFAFNGIEDNPHLPKNHIKNAVAYTGTHDTNTVKGWFTKEATPEEKKNFFSYIGKKVSEDKVSEEFVNIAMASKANLSIIPIQDILGLGAKARMNIPAQHRGNWKWRVTKEQLARKELEKLGEITRKHNRE
jgi:4-alpha-glucanotransferase